jgi:hypothetical protein
LHIINGAAGGVKRARLTQSGQHIAFVDAGRMSTSHARDIAVYSAFISTGIFPHIIF